MFHGVEIPTATSVHMEGASMNAENYVCPNGYNSMDDNIHQRKRNFDTENGHKTIHTINLRRG